MKNTLLLLCALILTLAPVTARTAPAAPESVYDRVMRTHEIRCGYVNYPPMLSRDPNTGKFTGIGVDIMTRVADILHVKLVWAEETSWANYIEGLQANRFDALCQLDFFVPGEVGKLDTTTPLFFTGIGIYKRPGDARFPDGDKDFDRPDVAISAIDGSIAMLIKDSDYPRAKLLSMPAMTDYALILDNVAQKKADLTFVERAFANGYLKTHPGSLVNIVEKTPLRVYPYIIPFKAGETRLQATFDNIVMLMLNNGEIEKILQKYEQGTPSFYRVARQYQ